MLEMASRIHSDNPGVRASHALAVDLSTAFAAPFALACAIFTKVATYVWEGAKCLQYFVHATLKSRCKQAKHGLISLSERLICWLPVCTSSHLTSTTYQDNYKYGRQ